MSNYRIQTFTNAGDIDSFFGQFAGAKGFCDWFNSNAAGRKNWAEQRIQSPSNWAKIWLSGTLLFNKDSFNLIEFLCLNSIFQNETGGNYSPLSETLGSSGHPGISYAFDKISGLKLAYNTLDGNKTALDLFNDTKFKNVNSSKPFGSILKDTTDTRWSGNTFPQGFSGNIPIETTISGKSNTFITEADFMKFRGRGYIQTTGRSNYKLLIKFVLNYNGNNTIINNIKTMWKPHGNDLDAIATISTNQQWDDLFQKTNSVIANYAVWVHTSPSKYNIINPSQNDTNLQKSIRNVASKIAGSGAGSYIGLFYARVMQLLNLIESYDINDGNNTNNTNNSQQTDTTQTGDEYQDNSLDYKNVDTTDNTPNNPNGALPGIVNIFKPTIKPNIIAFNLPPEVIQQQEIAQSLGNLPFVWYNAYQINYNDISYFKLYNNGNVPCLKLIFNDSLNKMKDQGFPLDDTKISIFLNPRSEQLKPIHIDFKIATFSVKDTTYTILGVIDINKLYTKSFLSLSNVSSLDALKNIAKILDMGFNTNIDATDDKMTWINTGDRIIDFMDEIIDNSYKSDETYLLSYIDYYYNINYVDIEKELNRDIKQDLGIENIGIEDVANLKNKELISSLFLTNDFSRKNSNGFFSEYKIINNSTSISINDGYLTKLKYYDALSKDFLIFDVDSITSKDNKNIILKGAPHDETFFKENINLIFSGKIDNDNVHKNYLYSEIQNNRNISELEKVGLEIKMPTPNYNLYKFQKVFLFLSNQSATPATPHVNNRLTGDWLIIDISFVFDGDTYQQNVKLIKKELELSPSELGK